MGFPRNGPLNFLIPHRSSLLLSTFGAPANDCKNAFGPLFYFGRLFEPLSAVWTKEKALSDGTSSTSSLCPQKLRIAAHGFTLTKRLEWRPNPHGDRAQPHTRRILVVNLATFMRREHGAFIAAFS